MRHPSLLALFGIAAFVASSPRESIAQSSSAPPTSSPAPSARPVSRSQEVLEAVHRSGAVPRCWNAFIQHQPEAPSVRFRVRVEVDANGTVSEAVVLDPTPTLFATCVRNEIRRASVPAGSAVTVTTTYSFGAGVPAPVPSR